MRRTFTLIAAGLAIVAGAAFAVELTLGDWRDSDALDRAGVMRDVTVTIEARPDPFLYRRDHWGLRGQDIAPERVSVLTVGGGGTDQPTLPEGQTWQAVMQRELRAAGSEDAVVANAGLSGRASTQHLQAFDDWFPHVPGLHPRFVLLDVGYNDEVSPVRPALPFTTRLHGSVIVRWLTPSGAESLPMPPAVDYTALQWTAEPAQPDRKGKDTDLSAYKQRLSALARAVHDMGAVPVFITQVRGDYRFRNGRPQGVAVVMKGRGNGVDRYRALSAFNKATLDVCRDDGLLCLDLATEVKFETEDFYDYVHKSPAGAEKMGRWLAGKLAGLV